MPYLKDDGVRQKLDAVVEHILSIFATYSIEGIDYEGFNLKGKLNYFLFKLAKKTCSCYADYAAFLGELEAAKLEIYRRQVAPYENKKIKENGDVK